MRRVGHCGDVVQLPERLTTHGVRATMHLDEEVDHQADVLSGRFNGDRRGGEEPTFQAVGIVIKNNWGATLKVLRPAPGGFRVVEGREAEQVVSWNFIAADPVA